MNPDRNDRQKRQLEYRMNLPLRHRYEGDLPRKCCQRGLLRRRGSLNSLWLRRLDRIRSVEIRWKSKQPKHMSAPQEDENQLYRKSPSPRSISSVLHQSSHNRHPRPYPSLNPPRQDLHPFPLAQKCPRVMFHQSRHRSSLSLLNIVPKALKPSSAAIMMQHIKHILLH